MKRKSSVYSCGLWKRNGNIGNAQSSFGLVIEFMDIEKLFCKQSLAQGECLCNSNQCQLIKEPRFQGLSTVFFFLTSQGISCCWIQSWDHLVYTVTQELILMNGLPFSLCGFHVPPGHVHPAALGVKKWRVGFKIRIFYGEKNSFYVSLMK